MEEKTLEKRALIILERLSNVQNLSPSTERMRDLISELAAKLREREDKVSQLWQLLDDIDTLDDAAKDKDKSFRDSCYKIQQKRWDIYNPDLPTPPKET